jgi:hypothetical protein
MNVTVVNPLVDKIGYRVFFTPTDVSAWWYRYYGENPHRNFQEILSRDLTFQPSNVIGVMAFFDRFPKSYLKTVSAYSSVDADAYSFGWPFVWLAASLLLLIRFISTLGLNSSRLMDRSMGAILLGGLILFPFTASIQALLFAQGMLLPMVFIALRNAKYFSIDAFKSKSILLNLMKNVGKGSRK